MEKFTDYYRLLEVHYDASPEVIRAAYHKLSAVFHPDSNSGSNAMALLNVAYDTLSDEKKRAAYHKKWLKNYGKDTSVGALDFAVATPDTARDAVAAMDDFFYSILNGYYERAYARLTEEDKAEVSLKDFTDFRKAVDACYEMKSYTVKFIKMLTGSLVGSVSYRRAAEIEVSVKEYDIAKNLDNSEKVVKYAVYDGAGWKVVLNMHSIKNATTRFRLLAEKIDNFDPIMLYRNAAKKIDYSTGLLSEFGLTEELEKEFYRCKRYRRPLSIVSVTGANEDIEKIARAIRPVLRMSDFAGITDSGAIAVVMPETDILKATLAEKKIKKIMGELGIREGACFVRKLDVRAFNSIKEALVNL